MKNLDKDLKKIDRNIGEKIYHCRTMLGMSRAELSRAVGVSHQQIVKYENGSNRVSASKLFLLAQRLEKKIDYFYSDALEVVDTAFFENRNNSRCFLSLVKKLSKLKNNKQRAALSILIDGLL